MQCVFCDNVNAPMSDKYMVRVVRAGSAWSVTVEGLPVCIECQTKIPQRIEANQPKRAVKNAD